LYDDRDERAGIKFKDADLIGLPLRITVGRKASEQIVECKWRHHSQLHEVEVSNLEAFIKNNDNWR
jgi:prolyl-tRNA synthetase